MRIFSVNDLNKMIANDVEDFVAMSENSYTEQLKAAAEHIAEAHAEKPIILLSGPSGSGKTTTAMRIETLLEKRHGLKCKTVSLDNYFISLTNEQLADISKIDLEAPTRLNIPLLAAHLEKIRRCEKVIIPSFSFATQQSIDGEKFQREPDEIVIFEGIHALNPEITGKIGDHATSVYVSVRTRLEHDGELLHPSKIRLMRRLMRDKLFRGRAITETMSFFAHVERGEQLYIMPHKHRAQIDIDTFIPFEASVYKRFLVPELEKVKNSYDQYGKYADVEKFLLLLDSVDEKLVPENSLIREFIGGSAYSY